MKYPCLWAKANETTEGQKFHPLLFHLMDVAMVAEQFYDKCLDPNSKQVLCEAWGTSEHQARQWVITLAALHDIGKASYDFQTKRPEC